MNFPAKTVMQRYAFVAALLVIGFLAVIAKAAYIMTVQKDFWMAVSSRFVRENVVVPPTRGNILADNGEVLASSLPEYKIYMDFMSWEKDSLRRAKEQHWRDSLLYGKMDSICRGAHAVLPDLSPEELKECLLKGREKKSHHWLLYKKRITYIQYCMLKQLPLFRLSANRGGFHTEEFKTRKNPYGRLAIRTIGSLYKGIDSARTGIELSYDTVLRGHPGRAHRQKVLRRYLPIIDEPAIDGCDVQTTLNVEMQDICEKALGDQLTSLQEKYGGCNAGVCILMEVATGDVKAITSLTRMDDGTYQEINADAVKNLYEPGSVFKPMSILVAMDDGHVKITDQVDVMNGQREMYGRTMRDADWRSSANRMLTVPQILQKSSNVGVSTLIDRYYHDNPQKFVEGIYRIGVAEDLKLPIPGYAKPKIRMPKPDLSNWSKTALPWMSIGYETQIPPISTLTFYNGIANNGKLVRPRLVKAVLRGGEVVRECPVVVLRDQMAKPEAVHAMQECLESVVSLGLGRKAKSRYFKVAGKTGTAQVWTKHGFSSQYLISFAGYFPADKPQYSCIVCIQKSAPASGGGMCAPVFKRVAETVMAQRLTDDYSQARDSVNCLIPAVYAGNMGAAARVLEALKVNHAYNAPGDGNVLAWGVCHTEGQNLTLSAVADAGGEKAVPDLTGYGLRDALFRLEKLGLRVKVVGMGKVKHQSIQPGAHFKKGQQIVLELDREARSKTGGITAKKDTVSSSRPPQTAEQDKKKPEKVEKSDKTEKKESPTKKEEKKKSSAKKEEEKTTVPRKQKSAADKKSR